MILVDTSVLIEFLRGTRNLATAYFEEIEKRQIPFGIPLLCAQEVLQGAANEREWKTLRQYLKSQRLCATTDPEKSHFEAARIFFDCRRRGLTIRSTVDCLIAQLVLEMDAELLHSDQDFERIAKVRALKFVDR